MTVPVAGAVSSSPMLFSSAMALGVLSVMAISSLPSVGAPVMSVTTIGISSINGAPFTWVTASGSTRYS